MMGDTVPEVWVAHQQEAPAPAMTLDAAYECLNVAPGAAWESIELARRKMVQLAHPERLVALSDDEGLRAQSQARRANAAFALILRSRTARCRSSPE